MKKDVFDILNLKKESNYKVILFDGICNYCNDKVNYIIKNDSQEIYKFLPIQSEKGQELIKYLGINKEIDSIILYIPNKAYFIKSNAVIEIAKEFSGLFKLLLIFKIIPSSFRDHFYDYFAKNRYKWYGKKESCMIPTPEIKRRFIDS